MPCPPPPPGRRKACRRLFVRTPLAGGAAVELDAKQANYLGNVMRLDEGEHVLLFDGASGEWIARIAAAGRKRMTLAVEDRTREQERSTDLWLAFAPVKRAQTDWLVEKATELGVARLLPVTTQRTIVERVRLERLEAIAIEAAEQCNRTSVPTIDEPQSLAAFLKGRDPERPIYFADEAGGQPAAGAFKPGPGKHPDRSRGRIHRRRARGHPLGCQRGSDQPRPAHPARRNRRLGRYHNLYGAGRGLALTRPGA